MWLQKTVSSYQRFRKKTKKPDWAAHQPSFYFIEIAISEKSKGNKTLDEPAKATIEPNPTTDL